MRPAAAGMGGLGIIVVLVAAYFGVDPQRMMALLGGGGRGQQPQQQGPVGAPDDEMGEFVAVVLGDTEDVWTELFAKQGYRYEAPTLVLFSGAVESACGRANASVGPFYCPADQKVYIDLSFYQDLKQKLGAPGDFAQAYVIAHEVGHHIQNLLGLTDLVHSQQGRVSQDEYNALSVKLELQADFLAGVWAHHAHKQRNILEQGDVEEALNAAAAIGDDRLQMQSRGYVTPDSFTHGTSAQRERWFRRGFESGDPNAWDPFEIAYADL